MAVEDIGNLTAVEFDSRPDVVYRAFSWRFDPASRVLWIPTWLAASTARRLVIALSLVIFVPALVEARCPTDLEIVWRLARRASSTGAVFRGLVTSVAKIPGGEVAHLEVDTVWKGRVPRQLALHNVTGTVTASGDELFNSTARNLVAGARDVVFTNQLSVAERQMLNVVTPPSSTFATQGCGIFDSASHDTRVLGNGREPE